MIIGKGVSIPVLVLFLLFTSMFTSLVSIYEMPQQMMGTNNTYVLTSSTDNNPIRSNLDIRIAYGLENMSYITAVSPEIFVFTTLNNRAVTVRGVMFQKFLYLENGKIIRGKIPESPSGALVGEDIAKNMNIHIGEKLTIIGSFTPSVAVINVTGIFYTGDPTDDEILVNLPTARCLAGIAEGKVSIIRLKTNDVNKVDDLMNPNYPKFKVNINSTAQAYLGNKLNFTVNITNMGHRPGWAHLMLTFQNTNIEKSVYVDREKSMNFTLYPTYEGNYTLKAVVKNNVFYYTYHTQISVLKKPTFINGASLAYVNSSTSYIVTTLGNQTVKSGTINITGPNNYSYNQVIKGKINVYFPYPGRYLIQYVSNNYSGSNITVTAYKMTTLSNLAYITPCPINGTIYAETGNAVKVISQGNVYFALDNGTMINESIIKINKNMYGNHLIKILVIYKNSMAVSNFIIHVVPDYPLKINSPVKNGSMVTYGKNITFQIMDPVPLKYLTYTVNGVQKNIFLNQSFNSDSFSNYTYSLTVMVNSTHFHTVITANDYWNRSSNINVKCNVYLQKDVIKPEIIVNKVVKIWGGNSTEVIAKDNVAVAKISVRFYNHYFNATGGDVYVHTMFRSGNSVIYVPPGKYNATVRAVDTSGNVNVTNFTIIINNTGEKNPPVIIGVTYANLSANNSYVVFRAFDNVGVVRISCYNGSQLIKYSFSNLLNITSADLTNGSYHLKIEAVDVNFNYAYFYTTIVKNYDDTIPPEIHISKTKIWSGNTTVVSATDNVMVKSISVYAFGRYFNGTLRVLVPTVFYTANGIEYISPGNYILNVTARDMNGNVNTTQLILKINNTGEKIPPVFLFGSSYTYNASDKIELKATDNVKVSKMWVVYDNREIANSTGGELSFNASLLPCGLITVYVYAEDINGNLAWKSVKLLIKDDIKPYLAFSRAVIWGGNSTTIIGKDNVRVAMMSVSVGNHTFTSLNGYLTIKTKFTYPDSIYYLHNGTYRLVVHLSDSSGNTNNSIFSLIIDNNGEKNPPVIMGESYGTVNLTSGVKFFSFDNVGVKKMWIKWNHSTIVEKSGNEITLRYGKLPAGCHIITIYAEDFNHNIGMMNATVYVTGISNVGLSVTLEKNNINTRDRGAVLISLMNHNVNEYYNLTIYINNILYYNSMIFLKAYQKKSVYVALPFLNPGTYKIKVNNKELTLKVIKSPVESLPTDLVLKYTKNLKFTESQSVIYKGFQISEGNFMLVISSLIAVTFILIFLGLYSTTLKGMKKNNIGILRAIGASNRQIFKLFMSDSWKYVLIPGMIGIGMGYVLILILNNFDVLTAFGHHLIIVPSIKDIITVVLLTLVFESVSMIIIFQSLMKKHVIHIMGRDYTKKTVTLDSLLKGAP